MTLNPTTENNAQPFIGRQRVILEKRTPDGILDLSSPQPPLKIHDTDGRGRVTPRDFTFDDVYQMMFDDLPNAPGSWEALRAWLDSKSWVVRVKTW
jgi:hypothetical protein